MMASRYNLYKDVGMLYELRTTLKVLGNFQLNPLSLIAYSTCEASLSPGAETGTQQVRLP